MNRKSKRGIASKNAQRLFCDRLTTLRALLLKIDARNVGLSKRRWHDVRRWLMAVEAHADEWGTTTTDASSLAACVKMSKRQARRTRIDTLNIGVVEAIRRYRPDGRRTADALAVSREMLTRLAIPDVSAPSPPTAHPPTPSQRSFLDGQSESTKFPQTAAGANSQPRRPKRGPQSTLKQEIITWLRKQLAQDPEATAKPLWTRLRRDRPDLQAPTLKTFSAYLSIARRRGAA